MEAMANIGQLAVFYSPRYIEQVFQLNYKTFRTLKHYVAFQRFYPYFSPSLPIGPLAPPNNELPYTDQLKKNVDNNFDVIDEYVVRTN